MRKTTEELKDEIKQIWPDLLFIWLWDQKSWWKPTFAEIKYLFDTSKLPEMAPIDEFMDCDDYAGQFVHEIKRKRYFAHKNGSLPEEQRIPVAVFFMACTKSRGMNINHVVAFAMCQEGNFIFDLMPNPEPRFWEVNSSKDIPYFISSS